MHNGQKPLVYVCRGLWEVGQVLVLGFATLTSSFLWCAGLVMNEQQQPNGNSEGIVGLDEPKKMTREDWRKKKELEEQRKLGNAPAEVDEEGKWVSWELTWWNYVDFSSK